MVFQITHSIYVCMYNYHKSRYRLVLEYKVTQLSRQNIIYHLIYLYMYVDISYTSRTFYYNCQLRHRNKFTPTQKQKTHNVIRT